ncbi:MAG: TULIP family P47-like protein, partial [Kangiellaceae bacterium]|nr:TULIP family P47-like protein [Kangiellaceae bacterium]
QVSITIEVALDQLRPTDGRLAVERGELVEFRLRGNNGPDEQAVVVLSVSYPNVPPSPTFPGQPSSDNDGTNPIDILNVFAKAINTPGELEKFDHAFVAVNLNSRAAHDAFKWLDPTSVAYAVTAKSDGTGVMAVLCMTEDRPAPPSQDVSPELIAEGARAGFLISKPRFLEKMLRGSLKLMFDKPAGAVDEDDVTADTPDTAKIWPRDFIALEGSGTRLTNTVELNVKNFEIDGKNEPAKLPARGFEADITDTFLTLRLSRFQHSYHKGWYDVFHDITLDTHLQLSDDGKHIELIPGIGEEDEDGNDLSQPDHTAIIEKTALGRGFDWAILALDVVVLVASFAQFARGASVAKSVQKGTTTTLKAGAKVTINATAVKKGGLALIAKRGAFML